MPQRTPAAPTINAPATKYGPTLELSQPGLNVVAKSQDVTVWIQNPTGMMTTAIR